MVVPLRSVGAGVHTRQASATGVEEMQDAMGVRWVGAPPLLLAEAVPIRPALKI